MDTWTRKIVDALTEEGEARARVNGLTRDRDLATQRYHAGIAEALITVAPELIKELLADRDK